ncbi:Enhancer of polycomb-like protein 1 [Gaertneriomyces sp. JEL0708]|nr:Enhancer of polycomb-like protein 1 [Gaertneriomyces sp. JEL0708]
MVSGQTAGLRSRKVDTKKPLAVYRYHEVPDLDIEASTQRALPQVNTGVEKEEEEEHHLQAALIASQAGHVHEKVTIPTPDASRIIGDFAKYYVNTFRQPSGLIRWTTTTEDVIPVPYNLDDEDSTFIAEHKKNIDAGKAPKDSDFTEYQFEEIIGALEDAGDDKVSGEPPSLDECCTYIQQHHRELLERMPAISAIYPHWKHRRYTERGGAHIQPTLRMQEDWASRPDTDPYVCFRRREVKQLRKTRRTDNQALERLRRLRDEMSKARDLLEMITQREAARKESIMLEHLVFEQRVLVRKLKKKLGIVTSEKDLDFSPVPMKRKIRRGDDPRDDVPRKIRLNPTSHRSAAQIAQALESRYRNRNHDQSPEVKARKKKAMEESQGWLDITEEPYVASDRPRAEMNRWRHDLDALRLLLADEQCREELHYPSGRRRIGRGGRIIIDRHVTPKVWMPKSGAKVRRSTSNVGTRSVLEVADTPVELTRQRWRYDDSEDEQQDESTVIIEDTADNVTYRTYHLGLSHDELTQKIINKPAYPDQFSPKQLTEAQRAAATAPIQPPTVVRSQSVPAPAPAGSSAAANNLAKKRLSRVDAAVPKPPAATAQKKRPQEPLDAKATIIKLMMQQAQRQALVQQQQYAQIQAAQQQAQSVAMQQGNGDSGAAAGTVGSQSASSPSAPSLANGGISSGTPLMAPATPMMNNNATPSPARMTPISGPQAGTPATPLPGTDGSGANQSSQLTKQQIQRLQQYQLAQRQQQQQQQLIAAQAQARQNQIQQPQQAPQPALQQSQSQAANLTTAGLLSNASGFTPNQLLYYQHPMNAVQQSPAQAQARAQVAQATVLQNGLRLGMNNPAIAALMSQHPQLTPAQLQQLILHHQQQQQQQQQQSHANANMSVQQHLLNQQQKLKATAGASPLMNSMAGVNGVINMNGYAAAMAAAAAAHSSQSHSTTSSVAGNDNTVNVSGAPSTGSPAGSVQQLQRQMSTPNSPANANGAVKPDNVHGDKDLGGSGAASHMTGNTGLSPRVHATKSAA